MKKTVFKLGSRFGVGLVLLIGLAGAAMFADEMAPRDPNAIDLSHRLKPPCREFPLGTDNLGRCVWSRTLHGAGISLGAALSATTISLGIGLVLGLVSGLCGGFTDGLLMRVADVVLAFPTLLLAVVIAGILGPSMKSTVLGMALAAWAWWARFVRGLTLSAAKKEFVLGGKVAGVGGTRLVSGYILPQLLPPVMVAASLNAGNMMVAVSGLSFLGLGARPPQPEWGAMLKEARVFLAQAPWMMLAPGLGITLSVLAFNLLGETLRDRLQVRETALL